MISKRSILAKHLFFDASLTGDFDLTSEEGRVAFLRERCYLKVQVTSSREAAREIERQREQQGSYRYLGKVRKR
jgi:hypothetical protein